MITKSVCSLCLGALLFCSALLAGTAQSQPAIVANDNRTPAGKLRSNVLTVNLEIAEGQWHPEAENGFTIPVYAFREAGHTLQIPGPLIRVPEGTEVQVTVHNALSIAAVLHGLYERPGKQSDSLDLQPGATQNVRFQAGAPGVYYYWATTTHSAIARRQKIESQLSGAIVVDPKDSRANDRVFVITLLDLDPSKLSTADEIVAINGKSWPYTERFTFHTGEEVHWRWLNPSGSDHAMHLHGFYFHTEAVGDGERNHVYEKDSQPYEVTHLVGVGETFDMSWVPERPGRWLFHCHMMGHMSEPNVPAEFEPATEHGHSSHAYNPENAGMGGLVLGITVLGQEESKTVVWKAERKLQLVLEPQEGRPAYSLDVRDTAQASQEPKMSSNRRLLGPPIILTRGQPVEIEVVNHSKEPTAIHWHGIELESYYDGVAGWTGSAQQTTPPIPPGESFVVRMTPPRSGTFIYHTHWHDRSQLVNGIYGPLIVLPPGQNFNPQNDKSFVFSMGLFEPFGEILLINGSPQPAALQLKTNTKYRFRLINIAPDNVKMRAALVRAGIPVDWRSIAKDGADLPPHAAIMTKANLSITVGETYDFEYETTMPEDLALEVYLPGPRIWTHQGLVFSDQ